MSKNEIILAALSSILFSNLILFGQVDLHVGLLLLGEQGAGVGVRAARVHQVIRARYALGQVPRAHVVAERIRLPSLHERGQTALVVGDERQAVPALAPLHKLGLLQKHKKK